MKSVLEQTQKHEIDLLRGQLELSVEAMREADRALELGALVQAQLVKALDGAQNRLAQLRPHYDGIMGRSIDRILQDSIAALTLAGVKP